MLSSMLSGSKVAFWFVFVWSLSGRSYTTTTADDTGVNQEKPVLKLRETDSGEYEFTILQIADIHLGENAWEDWGPEQDRKTFQAFDRFFEYEATTDLIVLTGDQLTGNNVDSNATAYYEILAEKLTQYNIPWALIFGNHDDAPFARSEEDIPTTKTSRIDLVHVDQQFQNSLTQSGPKELFGTSNYWISIYDAVLPEVVAARIVLLDSGGGSLEEQITNEQIEWFWQGHAEFSHTIPIFAFQHIPTTIPDFVFDDTICVGTHEDSVSPLSHDAGIVGALLQAGNVHLLGVGHDHGSDYCCQYSDILHLCFGRHSGYGGYGHLERGVRVYHLRFRRNLQLAGWNSYVRLESGDMVNRYVSSLES